MQTILENWSRDYLIAPEIEINTQADGRALMDEDLYVGLARVLGEPIVGLTDGVHYQFEPSRQVLADRAAVPRRNHRGADDLTLLLAK